MLIDTHAHIDDNKFNEDFPEMIKRLQETGVAKIINIGYNIPSSERSLALAEKYPWLQCAIGIHPHDASSANEDAYAKLLEWSENLQVVAIGEIGLDYYYNHSPRDVQQTVFRRQIQLAKDANLPVVIHDRDAHQDVYDILSQEATTELSGVMHCYSGSYEMAKRFIDLNFYISLAGPVTFKNAKTAKEVASKVALDRLLIETDSPYLAPEPHRGKRNEPAHVIHIAKEIARLRGQEWEEIARITAKNALRAFPRLRLQE